uniref:EF-hand domain-containing protein n=1 Tax=Pyrodinium bahamense TaxID=73915 RepID=A0A7S0B5T3_9DINO
MAQGSSGSRSSLSCTPATPPQLIRPPTAIMGASTSSCVNAAVGAYSQDDLMAFFVTLPANCRQKLLAVLKEQEQKRAGSEGQVPLTGEQAENLRSQMQVLADDSTGALKQLDLQDLFKDLGVNFKCKELELLLAAAAGPSGRAATPTEFVDYLFSA